MTYRDPPLGLLDYLSRKDELQIRTNKLLEQMITLLSASPGNAASSAIPTQQFQGLKNQLESGQYTPYNVRTFDMTIEQTDFPVILQGNNLMATSDGVLTGVTVKFNSASDDPLPLQYFIGKSIPFSRFYLSWTAQPGKTLYLIVGQGDTEFGVNNPTRVGIYREKSPINNILESDSPPTEDTLYSDFIDAELCSNIIFKIVNTSDVNITAQLIGNVEEDIDNSVTIGDAVTVIASTGVATIGVNLMGDDWHPYIAIVIAVPAGASIGEVKVSEVHRS